MAGRLRSAVLLFTAACAVYPLFAASAPPSTSPPPRPPAVYVVGDDMGWTVPPAGATDDALNKWAARHRFLVGDVLLFRYTGGDGPPLLLPRDGYERCSSAASPFAGGGGGGSFASFTLSRPGLYHFISRVPARCEAGQRMAVSVEDARPSRRSIGAPTPAPAPAPGTTTQAPEYTPPPPPPPAGHRRLSLAQKQFAAAAIGFGAGFVFVFLIVSLCVCLKR